MSEELIKLLTDCHKVLSAMYFGGNPHKDLLDRIQSALAAQQSQQEPVATVGYMDDYGDAQVQWAVKAPPYGTPLYTAPAPVQQEPVGYWDGKFSKDGGAILYEVKQVSFFGRTYENIPLYTTPLSGVRDGMLRDDWLDERDVKTAYEYMRECNFPDMAAGRVVDAAYRHITRAAEQPDTRPGTPLMLTMETLDLWHQIIHDESLERGDRLQRIAARISVIQDSVKRAADQVKGGRVCPNTLKLCACEKYAPCADQVNADQPADAVVVPLDLIKRIDDALGAFTGDEELLNSHIDTYNDVREIRAAQEGK